MKVNWDRAKKDLSRPTVCAAEDTSLRNTVIVGKSGSGKSTSIRNDIVIDAHEQRNCLVILDPHGTLADNVLGDLLPRGYEPRIEVLDLTFPDKVFGLDFQPYSDAEWRGLQLQENMRAVETFLQVLGRERGINFNTMPLLGTWTRNALMLRQRQKHPKPLRFVPYGLMFGHPIQMAMLADCDDAKLVWEFSQLARIPSVQAREEVVAPAKRLLDTFFRSVVVDAILSVPPVDLYGWIKEKKIIIVRSNALVSESETRGVMGSLPLLLSGIAALHEARFHSLLPIKLNIDEAARLNPGRVEANLMSQTRKWGVKWTLVFQQLPETEESREILQNTRRLEVFAQGSDESAELLSKQVATLLLDNLKIKSVQQRERTITRGYNREKVSTSGLWKDARGQKGENISTHIVTTPDLETIMDTVVERDTLNDQYLLKKRDIRRLRTGERIVIDDTTVSSQAEKVVPLEDLWTSENLKRQRIEEALARIRSRPHYHAPSYEPPRLDDGQRRKGAASRLRENGNEKS
jgi:hypothetical protein